MGKLQLKISSSGYRPLDQEISFLPKIEKGAPQTASGSMPSFEKTSVILN